MHLALATAFAVCCASLLPSQQATRHGADSKDRGLPQAPERIAPYHQDPAHRLNRIFRQLWMVRMAPAEVAAVLPDEGTPIEAGWVHKKRAGTAADTRWFGGDGRQLPLEDLANDAVEELAGLLRGLGEDDRTTLSTPPELAVLFQNDLLRAAERLRDLERQPQLVQLLVRAARFVALEADQLTRLQNPIAAAVGDGDTRDQLGASLPTDLHGSATGFREVLRRSTRLFDAERTLLWSRVYLAHPDGETALAAMLPTPVRDGERAGRGPTVPIGFRAVLVQGLIALGQDGKAHATPIVVDIRTQVLQNRDPLAATNATFTHDGLDFGIWQLERQGLRSGRAAAIYRRVHPDDQDLFRDYGTAKHTTYRGQCSLCHRVSDTPEPNLAGFPVLRPHVQASFATTGRERLLLAETQAQKLFDALLAER